MSSSPARQVGGADLTRGSQEAGKLEPLRLIFTICHHHAGLRDSEIRPWTQTVNMARGVQGFLGKEKSSIGTAGRKALVALKVTEGRCDHKTLAASSCPPVNGADIMRGEKLGPLTWTM